MSVDYRKWKTNKERNSNERERRIRYPMEDWSLCSTQGPEAAP